MPMNLNDMPMNTPIKAVFSNGNHTHYVYGVRRAQLKREGEFVPPPDVFLADGELPASTYTLRGYSE